MKILITGAAGFIGFHLSKKLLSEGHEVVGIDSMNHYYDINLKIARLAELGIKNLKFEQDELSEYSHKNFSFFILDITHELAISKLFQNHNFDVVINLAAQAGVRNSISNPKAYIENNLIGFYNVLECCRHKRPKHLIFASSSSVYGFNQQVPFSADHHTDHPVSLYAATKKSNEMLAHSYSHLYDIPSTGLRFFTVYGPWGRPDMAYFSFTSKILNGEKIAVFNNGELYRDFTFIDDIVEGVCATINHPPIASELKPESNFLPSESFAPYRLFNIGNNKPVKILDFVRVLENILQKEAQIEYKEMQAGDVYKTFSDISPLQKLTNFQPNTSIEQGLEKFYDWYKSYYKIA